MMESSQIITSLIRTDRPKAHRTGKQKLVTAVNSAHEVSSRDGTKVLLEAYRHMTAKLHCAKGENLSTLREILATRKYDTDKSDEYLRNYENCFANLRTSSIVLMEIGVNKGGSLLLWRDYFPQGNIVGVDLNPPLELADETGRIRMFQCDQADSESLDALASTVSPSGLDVIIDDASHVASLTAITFRTLFYKHLKPGGFYAIEDWGTGYWTNWPDGTFPEHITDLPMFEGDGNQFRSHQSGMVGLLKQLIDECGLDDVYHPRFGAPGGRRSLIRSLHISSGLAIITRMPEVRS